MGFVTSSSTIQLYAYLTKYARDKIINGEIVDFKTKYFSLHDDDVNYLISKYDIGIDSSGETIYNTLKSGFIPDVTGDPNACIKSMVSKVLEKNMLITKQKVYGCTNPQATNYNSQATDDDGSCIIPPPRQLTIGFDVISKDQSNGSGYNIYSNQHSTTFAVRLKQPINDPNPPTAAELANSNFNIQVILTQGFVNPATIPTTQPITFAGGNPKYPSVQFSLRPRNIPSGEGPIEETVTVKLKITTTSTNRTIETGKDIFTWTRKVGWQP